MSRFGSGVMAVTAAVLVRSRWGEVCRWQGGGPPSFLVHKVCSTFRSTKYLCIIHITPGCRGEKDRTDAKDEREFGELESMAGSRSGSGRVKCASGSAVRCFDRIFTEEKTYEGVEYRSIYRCRVLLESKGVMEMKGDIHSVPYTAGYWVSVIWLICLSSSCRA